MRFNPLQTTLEPTSPAQDLTTTVVHVQPCLSPKTDYDLVIVGGGIVGLVLAGAMQSSGLQIAVIESQANSLAVAKGQAYNLSPLSRCILQGVGAWDEMCDRVQPYRTIALSDADSPQVIHFQPNDLGLDPLGYVTEHAVLLSALLRVIDAADNIDWICPARLMQTTYCADHVLADLHLNGDAYQLQTKLVIAADGARSPLREQAGIQSWGWRYPQSCVVAFIQPEKSHQGIAYERFWPSGPFAILPLVNGLCRIVWTAPHDEAQALLALSPAEFLRELKTRYGDQMGDLSLVGDRFAFSVQLRQSRTYVRSRLALIGDAAHSCHPVGGQGLNLGIRDAAILAEVLQTALHKGQDLGSLDVLKHYASHQQWVNWIMLGMTDLLVRTFSNTVWPILPLRRLGLSILNHSSLLRTPILKLMTGLTGKIPAIARPFLEQWQKQQTLR
jgi:2-octaprenyl-6-methoxyphenol hydroxylase